MSDERKLESIRFAQESTKQIITLSTGIMTLVLGAASIGAVALKGAAFYFALLILLFLTLSLLCGIFTLYALSGVLSDKKQWDSQEDPLDTSNYKFFGRSQFITFLMGIVLVAIAALFWPQKEEAHKFSLAQPLHLQCHATKDGFVCVVLH